MVTVETGHNRERNIIVRIGPNDSPQGGNGGLTKVEGGLRAGVGE